MIRRLVLLGFMSIIEPGSVWQLTIAATFSLIYSVIQLQANPFKELTNGYMAVCVSACLTMALLCCLVFKFNNLTELPDIKSKMSFQQQAAYDPQETGLVLLMLTAIFFTLATGIVITYISILAERQRLKMEDLKSSARRLRYVSTNLSVPAPPLSGQEEDGPRHFHLFLSHVWGTGQDQMRIVKQRLLEMIPDLSVFLDVDDLEDISNLQGYIAVHHAVHRSECVECPVHHSSHSTVRASGISSARRPSLSTALTATSSRRTA